MGLGPPTPPRYSGTPNSQNNLGKEERSWRTHTSCLGTTLQKSRQCGTGLKADIQTNRTEHRAQKLTFA